MSSNGCGKHRFGRVSSTFLHVNPYIYLITIIIVLNMLAYMPVHHASWINMLVLLDGILP